MSPDGQQFYFVVGTTPRQSPPPVSHIAIVQNWVEEMKAKLAEQAR